MINGLILLLLNFSYFICNFYPKHLLEFNGVLSIVGVVLNLVFYFIFALFLIIVFNKNKNPFSENIFSPLETFWQKIKIKKIALIIAAKIVFDILKLSLSGVLGKNVLYFIDFSTIALWIIFYNICVTKESNIFLKKPLLTGFALLTVFALSTVTNLSIIGENNLLSEKNNLFSEYLNVETNNLDFIFQIKNFALDTLLGLIFIVAHSLLNKGTEKKHRSSWTVLITRIMILALSAFAIAFIKLLVFPYSSISGFGISTTENTSMVKTDSFSSNTKISYVSRVGADRTDQIVFSRTRDEIYYNGDLILTFMSNDNDGANSYKMNGNQIIIEDRFEKFNCENVDFYVYKNRVVCFLDGDKPMAVPFNCAENVSYNKSMLAVYKALIENGNWNFFEQGTEYLLEYDEAFIKPYLERFSAGAFSEKEIDSLNKLGVKKEYIKRVSGELMAAEKTVDDSRS